MADPPTKTKKRADPYQCGCAHACPHWWGNHGWFTCDCGLAMQSNNPTSIEGHIHTCASWIQENNAQIKQGASYEPRAKKTKRAGEPEAVRFLFAGEGNISPTAPAESPSLSETQGDMLRHMQRARFVF